LKKNLPNEELILDLRSTILEFRFGTEYFQIVNRTSKIVLRYSHDHAIDLLQLAYDLYLKPQTL
jgi:hypothetical protein